MNRRNGSTYRINFFKGKSLSNKLESMIAEACKSNQRWLRKQLPWSKGPRVSSRGTVLSHRGPAVLSEADAVMQFARFLNKAGVPWSDLHMELAPAQWMFDPRADNKRPPAIDLAVIKRERLAKAKFPVTRGDFKFDAVFEFKLASDFWLYNSQGERKVNAKPPVSVVRGIDSDAHKVAQYLEDGLAKLGYLIVIEETDFANARWHPGSHVSSIPNLRVVFLKAWK